MIRLNVITYCDEKKSYDSHHKNTLYINPKNIVLIEELPRKHSNSVVVLDVKTPHGDTLFCSQKHSEILNSISGTDNCLMQNLGEIAKEIDRVVKAIDRLPA